MGEQMIVAAVFIIHFEPPLDESAHGRQFNGEVN
jgi:hypothetical protein